jgi:hypothetical protein
MDFRQNSVDKSKAIDRWAVDDPLDNTAELLTALKQIPEKEEGFKLPWCLSSGQGPLRRYVGSGFWALAGNRVCLHIHTSHRT